MIYAGISEKSTIPAMGLLIWIPFQFTWVWDGEVPRKEAVASAPRPWFLMKTGVFSDRISDRDR